MKTYKPNDKKYIHVYGRTVDTVPMPIFWTASGIEFTTSGSEAWLELEVDYDSNDVWFEIEMNGVMTQHMMLPVGKNKICLFRGYNAGERKTIRARLCGQPSQDDSKRKLLFHELILMDGELEEIAPKSMKIEFIGDSLTSGEGLTGGKEIDSWCGGIFGLQGHYGLKVAEHFNADYSIVSQCGWGVCTGWDNNIKSIIPPYYSQICGFLKGEENEKLGALDKHDFASWQPEVIVINLGTNDGGATGQPAWQDPETGIMHKQVIDENGDLDVHSRERLVGASVAFLKDVRKNNPNALIIWAYGMCGYIMEKYLMEAVDIYKTETKDENVGYVSLAEATDDTIGAHGHPGVSDHAAAAQRIIDYIDNNLKK